MDSHTLKHSAWIKLLNRLLQSYGQSNVSRPAADDSLQPISCVDEFRPPARAGTVKLGSVGISKKQQEDEDALRVVGKIERLLKESGKWRETLLLEGEESEECSEDTRGNEGGGRSGGTCDEEDDLAYADVAVSPVLLILAALEASCTSVMTVPGAWRCSPCMRWCVAKGMYSRCT